jgi:hypothetical protein
VESAERLGGDTGRQAEPVWDEVRARWRFPSGFAVVAPLLFLQVALWLFVFGVAGIFHEGPNGKGMGTDFAVFSGAAYALKHGENPYDYRVLYRSERALLTKQHLPVTKNELNVRAGNPPLFYWALEPLTTLPFQRVAIVWIVSLYLLSAVGFLLSLRFLGWKSWLVPTILFLLMPQVVTGCLYGNVHAPIFAAIALCLILADRYPALAGTIAAVGWLKPQLALPLLLLVFLFHAPHRKSFAVGFGAATCGLLALTAATTGFYSLVQWVAGLNSWSKGISREPNIASLSGLYVSWASRPLQLAIATALLGCAVFLTVLAWKRTARATPVPILSVGWLWAAWFLVAPFSHFPDEIVLTLPVLAVLARDAARLSTRLGIATLYLAFFSLVLFPTPLVSVSVVALGLVLYRASQVPEVSRPLRAGEAYVV